MTLERKSPGARESIHAVDEELPLDPQRPIVDAHHHLWDYPATFWDYSAELTPPPRFLLPELVETIARSGHNIRQSVFVECHAMYRADGPEELRPIGETEFVNGIAAMSASGGYGDCRVAAIVGCADLRLGDRAKAVLEAHIAAGNGRFRGIRTWTAYVDAALLGRPPDAAVKGLLRDSAFRRGVSLLEPLGLSLDVWCLHTQIPELTELAAAFPDTTIILDHVGSPLSFGPYAGREAEVFEDWSKAIIDLGRRPNVMVKVGGLGVDLAVPVGTHYGSTPSGTLARKWRPYFETCIAAFGPERCMFESNFPPDNATCSYGALWNACKLIVAGYSEAEKTALFSGTARRAYRLG